MCRSVPLGHTIMVLMDCGNLKFWNVHDLNSRARRAFVADIVSQERVFVVCLQATKLSIIDDWVIVNLFGSGFGYYFVPAADTRGGILIVWRSDSWSGSHVHKLSHSLTIKLTSVGRTSMQWWLSVVYGPQSGHDKGAFLSQLHGLRSAHLGPWLVRGDFNLIYHATDKNNMRLNQSLMTTFRNALNSMELHL
jgi:exonuclease III